MENPSSPLETLRQLKEMLDAGTLTPTEFEALKQRLVFTPPVSPASAPAEAASPAAPAAPTGAAPPVPAAPSAASAPAVEPTPPPLPTATTSNALPPAPGVVEADALVFEPVAEPLFVAGASPDFPVAVGGPSYVSAEALPDDQGPDLAPVPAEGNSSLGLVLAIAGVLVFLAVVAYLGFNRPPSEHISSTSQTAADSVAAPIETGPQVAPLPATATVPETVRVAPTNPAPALPSRAEMEQRAAAVRDSAAPATAPTAPDSAVHQ